MNGSKETVQTSNSGVRKKRNWTEKHATAIQNSTYFWKAIVDSFHSRDKRHVYEAIFIRKSYILERCD